MARRRARPQAAVPLIHWGDDLTIALFARAPYSSHGTIRILCRKFTHLLRSDAFRQERIKSGYAENGAVIVETFVIAAYRGRMAEVRGLFISGARCSPPRCLLA